MKWIMIIILGGASSLGTFALSAMAFGNLVPYEGRLLALIFAVLSATGNFMIILLLAIIIMSKEE